MGRRQAAHPADEAGAESRTPAALVVSGVLRRATSTVVLVEGVSDQTALQTLAARCSRDLAASQACIVAMGGATGVGRFWRALGPQGAGLRVVGLCDAAEERYFQRAAQDAAGGARLRGPGAASGDVFVCTADLEDELIRSLGIEAVQAVVAEAGELGALRTFQQQPAQRGRGPEAQIRRFLGTRSGRKIQYAGLLAERVDLARVPRPLERLLHQVT